MKSITIKTYVCNDSNVLKINLKENINDELISQNWNELYRTTFDEFLLQNYYKKSNFEYIKQNEIKIVCDNNKDVKSSQNYDFKDWTQKAILLSFEYQKFSFNRKKYELPNYHLDFIINSSHIRVSFLSNQLYDAFGIKDSILVKEIFKNNHLDSLRYDN